MRRRTTASALLTVALLTCSAAGQPPVPPADTTDALIQKALANDADVQVARAKLALAEAELAKARQASVGRVLGLRALVEQQRAEVAVLAELAGLHAARHKAGAVSLEELLTAQAKLTTAKAALARTETELRLLTGDGPKLAPAPGTGLRITVPPLGSLPPDQNPEFLRELAAWLNQSAAAKVSGPIPDSIRAALDKKVRFEANVHAISISVLLDHLRREAGPNVAVRGTASGLSLENPPPVELPIGAWFQMFVDDPANKAKLRVYVREYGLLIADEKTAPPDAITVTEFWRARPAEAKQPEPKQPAAKQHEFAHDKLPAAIKVKAGETIFVTFPVKTADVKEAKAGSDNPAVVVQVASRDRMVLVVIRAERAGKARVTWDITDMAGRRFSERGREVEFE